jgi:hypothetical protein
MAGKVKLKKVFENEAVRVELIRLIGFAWR